MSNSSARRWLLGRRVAILKGGWSRERSVSLKTGAAVEGAFRRLKIPFKSIDVKTDIESVLKKNRIDFCFIALHGEFGEDGGIQALLDSLTIPYTGCDAISSAVAMDKEFSKQLFRKKRIPTADWMTINSSDLKKSHTKTLDAIRSKFLTLPLFVKPADQGSAIGVTKVDSWATLPTALQKCFRVSSRAMIERFIPGRELTVGILGDKILPVVEIIPKHSFYDFHSKYAKGGSRHITPAPLKPAQSKAIQLASKKAFLSLGCSVYGRVDVILSPSGEFFVLEVNTIPGMTPTSLLPDAASAVGISFDELVLKIVDLSIAK